MAFQLGGIQTGVNAEVRRAIADPGSRPAFAIQLNALQAMCRRGLRLPARDDRHSHALRHRPHGLGAGHLADRFGHPRHVHGLVRPVPRLGTLRPCTPAPPLAAGHRRLLRRLAADHREPRVHPRLRQRLHPLLAGLVYGWRGAAVFAALQIVIVLGVYGTDPKLQPADATALLLPGFCVIAGAVGVTLRNLLLRFGTASQALTETRARLAVNEAVEGERTRLAREMHDSVAKTLHGLALAADGLACSSDRMDPLAVRHQAELVARAARRAAAESRELLSDLRRESGLDGGVDVVRELRARTDDFTRRHGLTATFRLLDDAPIPHVPQVVARQLLTIASEAMENAHRHAQPTYLVVLAGVKGDVLRVSVYDDGRGLPTGITLDDLRHAYHFGLVGMVERAASIGARIRIGKGQAAKGTEVRLELPIAALLAAPGTDQPD